MIGLLVIGVMIGVACIGAYQIYLDNQDKKKKSNCPCGGNCKCNE